MNELFKGKRMLLFDLDGTLLTSERKISERTLEALNKCRGGFLIGICTSRSEPNSMRFTGEISPDCIISSGGAMIRYGDNVITECLTADETRNIIAVIRSICGDVNITADTADAEYYRNFIPEEDVLEKSWGDSIYDDMRDFDRPALKICFEETNGDTAEKVSAALPGCDCIRFTDGYWYKLTKAGITKESAIEKLCSVIGITVDEVISFGDDLADAGMLRLCGTGVAMGNAPEEVKRTADIVIGGNDEDGIADFLSACFLSENNT
ncbi:MAG: HAD-IIB family hydrolase [Oscillospiraceae bacterium]|nr:HAD-IIB family hydrolase [Oscillospiraceae bacterium]